MSRSGGQGTGAERVGCGPPKVRSDSGAERGLVTIELAIGLLTALTAAAFLLWFILLGVAQARIQETSSQVARLGSRGDSEAVAKVLKDAPERAEVTVDRSSGDIQVKVTLPVSFLNLGEVILTANSRYPLEPGVR